MQSSDLQVTSRVMWWQLTKVSQLHIRTEMRSVIIIYTLSFTAILLWYFIIIRHTMQSISVNPLHLVAFLIFFKLVLLSLGIVYLKDLIKTMK